MQHPDLAGKMIAPAQLCNKILAVLGLTKPRLPGLLHRWKTDFRNSHHAKAQLIQQGNKLLDMVGTQIWEYTVYRDYIKPAFAVNFFLRKNQAEWYETTFLTKLLLNFPNLLGQGKLVSSGNLYYYLLNGTYLGNQFCVFPRLPLVAGHELNSKCHLWIPRVNLFLLQKRHREWTGQIMFIPG